jgi:hypothetical protein
MAVTMNNGTAPFTFQAVVGEVRARFVCKIAFSIAFPAATKTHILDIKSNRSSSVSLCSTGTNLSLADIPRRHERQRAVLSYVTHITDEPHSDSPVVVVTDAEGKTAVSQVYTVGAGPTKDCVDVAATLAVGTSGISTYSVGINAGFGAQSAHSSADVRKYRRSPYILRPDSFSILTTVCIPKSIAIFFSCHPPVLPIHPCLALPISLA